MSLICQPVEIKNLIDEFLTDQDRIRLIEVVGRNTRDGVFWCMKIQKANACPQIMMQICGFGFFNNQFFRDFVRRISESEVCHFISYKNVQALTIVGKYKLFRPSIVGAIMFNDTNRRQIDSEFVKKTSILLRIVIAVDKNGMYFDEDDEFAECCGDKSIPRVQLRALLGKKQVALKHRYARH